MPHGHHQRRHVTTTVAPSGESSTRRHRHQHSGGDVRRHGQPSSLHREIVDVAHGLLSTREMFARLPELLCRNERLRVGRDEACWNGTAIAP